MVFGKRSRIDDGDAELRWAGRRGYLGGAQAEVQVSTSTCIYLHLLLSSSRESPQDLTVLRFPVPSSGPSKAWGPHRLWDNYEHRIYSSWGSDLTLIQKRPAHSPESFFLEKTQEHPLPIALRPTLSRDGAGQPQRRLVLLSQAESRTLSLCFCSLPSQGPKPTQCLSISPPHIPQLYPD